MADLADFLEREAPDHAGLVAAYRAARARRAANGANYQAWVDGRPGPYAEKDIPPGPAEYEIPGLELAMRVLVNRYADHPDYQPEWSK